jgi:hypothetical protein
LPGDVAGGDAVDDGADVGLDAGHEGGEVAVAAGHAFEPGLPLAGHGGALDVGVDDADEVDALVGGGERLAVADDVFAAQEGLDDLGPGRGGAEAELAHGVGELFLLEGLAGGLHRGEQGGLAVVRGRAGLFGDRLDVLDALRLAALEAGGEGLIGSFGVGRGLAAGLCRHFWRWFGRLAVTDVEDLPAGLLDRGAAALVEVDDRAAGDRGEDGGGGVDVVLVPGGEQAAADEVVDLRLVAGEAGAGGGGGREDRVVVGDVGVVDEAAAERGGAGAGGEQAGVAAGDGGDDGGQGGGDVLR